MYQSMYIVVQDKALAIDDLGQPIICNVVHNDDIEWVDWDSEDVIDWLDLSPTTREIYKKAVDFLQTHEQQAFYIK